MVDSMVGAEHASASGQARADDRAASRWGLRRARLVAIVAAIVGIVSALVIPLLPVHQEQATLSWPQNGVTTSVEAPLVSYAPFTFDARIPCATAAGLDDGGLLVSTIPAGAPGTEQYGLIAKTVAASESTPARLEVILRDRSLISTPLSELRGVDCAIVISSDSNRTTASITGPGGELTTKTVEGDVRPQMVGVFSDLDGSAPAGLQVTAELDTRFSTTPTLIKIVAMIVAVLATLLALLALHRLDLTDGRRARRFLPARWWRFGVVDVVVIGTLLLWHFIGATTADDGYQYTMARSAQSSGYMSNYFRYFGVPETPFGTPYYYIFGLLDDIWNASPWVRLPALLAGIVTWMVLSREVVPRLGAAARTSRLALWTGALGFLAVWLPYNNGLRPEPIVAAGVLLTWCSVERAIATRRLLPAAVAILVAAATLSVGPSGIICFAALLAGLRPLLRIVIARAKTVGFAALLLPLVAAGTAILVAIFADQTLAVVPAMQDAHDAGGPSEKWFSENLRYQWLLNDTADGSLSRRFGIFVMFLGLAVSVLAMLRKGGRIPGTSAGPSRRIIGVTFGAVALMMFTPTKWTHHLGVFAGLAGALAVLTAVAVSTAVLRSPRNRALFAAGILFLLAFTFIGTNNYWYVSAWGVMWWDKPPSLAGTGAATVLFGGAIVMVAVAAWCHVRDSRVPEPGSRTRWLWALPPLTIAAAAMVLFEVLSLAKSTVSQYPAYSVGRSNFDALRGQNCGLANDVLLETDPNASMLQPLSGDAATALAGTESTGFGPNGVASDLSADAETAASGTANMVNPDTTTTTTDTAAGTGGGEGSVGVNGSSVALPYGLDPATTPVLGSYRTSEQTPASLVSGWYGLPAVGDDGTRGDIVSIAVAGRIRSMDRDGIVTYGQDLELEYGVRRPDGSVDVLGRALPFDIGPEPSWRNVRVPLDQLPAEADAVRLVASDEDRDPDQWLAVTPPRVPQTRTLQDVVGSDTPVLADWAVGLQFPCQQPFSHLNGVAEVPGYRILPDRPGAVSTNRWEDHFGGGPLGWTDQLLTAETIPSYLDHDWRRDWGQIEQFTPRNESAVPAELTTVTERRSGLWNPGPMTLRF
ncbi:arabinosyltransferase domain-containing protein [Rhodococcus sp. AG1013]|uniref:arabinosyltransferase domain-containing protein n=1 Tax=Rhodococcus sp. AG1013 TaxID=2183996 RepID=UPI00215DAE5C|nr:arabinosyltransferase domain-containing protein [Rhodococcus sp. AG1013]